MRKGSIIKPLRYFLSENDSTAQSPVFLAIINVRKRLLLIPVNEVQVTQV